MNQNRIAPLRHGTGLNQRELGEKIGVGQTTISAWETGKNEPDSKSMHKMAQLFHVSIGYLMGYEADNGHRGLSLEEWNRVQDEMHRRHEEETAARQYEEYLKQEAGEPTDEELKALEEDELYREWDKTGPTNFFESFKLDSYFEYLTEAQRKRVIAIVEQMFPNVTEGKYLDEVIHE